MKSFPRAITRGLLLTFLLLCGGQAAAQTFTLEQVMSSPFPSELTVSKQGDKIAWAFNAQGKRNIWIAEGPILAARPLTRYDSDTGQVLTDVVFSPNGSSIAYVRGEGRNSAGEYPNPTTDSTAPKQEVWVVEIRSGRTTKMGEGRAPMFTPAGDQILWIRDGDLWTAPLFGGKERKLFEMRGNVSAPQWSPDGSQLAFASTRGDRSFISVYELRTNRLRFLSPSVDRDSAPQWSPDGHRIAFVRLFNVPDTFSNDRDRLQPWAIWVADARTGEGKQIWRSGEGDDDTFFPGFTT